MKLFDLLCVCALFSTLQAARVANRAKTTDLKRHAAGVTLASGATQAVTGPTPLTTRQRESNRASIGFVWGMLKMKGNSYTDTFCSRSKDDCKTVDGYPGGNSHSELTFDAVTKELPHIPKKEEMGFIRRLGDLGYFIFNDLLWNKDWKTFPIGADFEDHRKHRPTADLLMGSNSPAWTRLMIRNAVADFFQGRTSMTKDDYSGFVTKIFHKILLDMDLTDIEVLDFQKYMGTSLKVALFPRWLVNTFNDTFGLPWARKQRDLWLEKYEAALDRDTRGFMPKLEGRDRRFLADLLLTTMTSAGGMSVPSVIDVVLGVVYGGETSPWKVADRSLTEKNIMPLVLEAVRRYPAVVGFPSWSPDVSKRMVLNLAMALRDPRAWDEPEVFKLRPLSEYHQKVGSGTKIGVAWAEQAKGPDGLTPDSRGCPGQELSIVIITEFLRGLLPHQKQWVVTEMPDDGIKIIEGPCAATAFTLSRGADPSEPPNFVNPPVDPEAHTDEEAQRQYALSMTSNHATPHKAPRFHCPTECQECCRQNHYWSVWNAQDDSRFKCVMPGADVPNFKVVGRTCAPATLRNSDNSQGKSTCELTDTEIAFEMHKKLPKCTYAPLVQTFAEFLGEGKVQNYCSLTYFGSLTGLAIIGGVIDAQYFKVYEPVTGGVCGSKVGELMPTGLLNNICEAANLRHKQCEKVEEGGLCKQLEDDLDSGRLDGVALAMWAAAVAALQEKHDFPKPVGSRLLKKFRIHGWNARTVAYEAPFYDKEIDLVGGGFQCMMTKLQDFPVNDDFEDAGRNNYAQKFAAGAGSLNLLSPENSNDVLTAYFDRYSLYQTPQHFVVPSHELQTDETLERFIFQSIGAHRVEPLDNGRTISLNPININGQATAARVGSPGLLETLPMAEQHNAGFIVRLEGLFENIPVRKGMQGWGGNAFFTKAGKLMALQYRGETTVVGQDPKKWEVFKYIFRSSLISTITAFDHLICTHILASNSLAIASVETLPDNHGLRLLLTPHTWGTLNINMKAGTNLFTKGMLVHRASPYDDEAFYSNDGSDGKLWKMIPALRYTKFMDTYSKYSEAKRSVLGMGMPQIPLFEDGKLLYEALNKYVSNAVHTIYGAQCDTALQADIRAQNFIAAFMDANADTPDFWPREFYAAGSDCDHLIDFLSEQVFMVTGWHRHVGTVADFFRDTSFVATSWKEGETQARPKQSMLMMLLAASTNARYPKLNQSLADIYSRDYLFRDVFASLHNSMQEVQEEVEKRNKERKNAGNLGFHQMEPMHIEWGVQV